MGAVFTTRALQDLAGHINRADSLETLVDAILRGLDESLGFKHSAILVPAEEPGVLVTIATRGYAENGAGAEVRFGEGIAGLVAEARKPIRISGLMRGMLYALRDAPGCGGRRRRSCAAGGSRCPASRIRRASSASRCSCAASWSACSASRATCRIAFTTKTSRRSSCSAATSRSPIQNMQLQERSAETAEAPAHAPAAARRTDAGAASEAARATRHRLLRRRRMHPARRRVSDPQPAREDPVAAAHRARDARDGRNSRTASCGWTSR